MEFTKQGDLGTPERHARHELERDVTDGTLIAKVRNVSPIHTMYKREQITLAQFSAGKYMRECFVKGFVGIKSLQITERIDGGCKVPEMTDSQVHAMHQYLRGLAAAGLEKDLIADVCCWEKSLTRRGMNGAAIAKLRFRFSKALDSVAKQFGFK